VRIAIIGSGAAAVGALHGILGGEREVEVAVFDRGVSPHGELETGVAPERWSHEDHRRLYRAARGELGLRFPPPKTHFGQRLPQHRVDGVPRPFRSELFGGLTNFWGATMLPFTSDELAPWPIDDLSEEYREIAHLVGIAGRRDALNEYFPEEFSNLPPLRPLPAVERLESAVNAAPAEGAYRVVAGANRAAVETRPEEPRSCVYCGECMVGCFRDSVYGARHSMEGLLGRPQVRYLVGDVRAVDPARGAVVVRGAQGTEEHAGFDRILLAAGCLGSTEIVMRSLGLREGPEVFDNAVYVFPILFLGRRASRDPADHYVALSNLILGCLPREPGRDFVQAQVYPFFDYLWRYYLPVGAWRLVQPLARRLRARVLWVRMYLHSRRSPRYALHLDGSGRLRLSSAAPGATPGELAPLMRSLRRAVGREGFYLPPVRPLPQRTSSHYAGTLPFGGEAVPVAADGAVLPGVHLCDSATFPEAPATSPTFTIMANALRIGRSAVA